MTRAMLHIYNNSTSTRLFKISDGARNLCLSFMISSMLRRFLS